MKKKYFLFEPNLGKKELENLTSCIDSNWISSSGKFVSEFERNFTEYLGGGNAVAVSNGTTAIELALASFDVGEGHEVIVPNFTFAATINAVIHSGAKPVLVDCDEETWTIDLKKIGKAINSKTKALIPVDIYGQPAKIDEINELAKKNNLLVIEDCAESLGATYKNRNIGLDVDCSTFSFHANKLITTGEGGMVVFNDFNVAKKARVLLNQGRSAEKKYLHDFAGFNFRMSNLQAAIGVAQMEQIDIFLQKRKAIFNNYDNLFKRNNLIKLLPSNNWSSNSCWLYTILIKDIGEMKRDQLIYLLNKQDIETRPGFYPLHNMKPYSKYGNGSYLVSDYLGANSISIPTTLSLSLKDQEYIYNSIVNSINKLN